MEVIEWSRPMAPLLPGLHSPSVSELPSADCQPPSTLSGHSFNPLENRFTEKCLKIFVRPNLFFMLSEQKSLWKSDVEMYRVPFHFLLRFPQ